MTGGSLDAHVVVDGRAGFRLDATIIMEPGETLAVMGPSGAGKSTLLQAIAGLVRLRDGRVRIDDWEVAARRRHVPPAQRGVVLLGQEPRLFPHLSARENVAFGLRARGVARAVAVGDADEWLWRVGLPGAGDHRPRELSGGQQQRVALARALATSPKLLLLDEPLSALDAQTAGDVRTLLREQLHATHATAVVITHDAVDAAALGRRLLILERGRVTQEGAVAEVLQTPATHFVAAVAGMNRIVGVAQDGGWRHPDSPAELVAADAASRAAASAAGGALAALVRPSAVRLEPVADLSWTGALRLPAEPTPPGEWLARIVRLEPTPAGARVHVADPPLAADVTADVVAAAALAPGMPVRVRVAACDVRFAPAGDEVRGDAAAPGPGS